MALMAKKRSGGEHATPRTTIQVPVPWLDLARQLARINKQPTLWHILALLAEDADRNGLARPRLPWEDGQEKKGKA